MGVRVLCADESLELDEQVVKLDYPEEYHLIRQTLGIPESSRELGGQLPLNMHMHYLNGVNFDKGCYIGQELTQRTFHTGVVRKVALPFLLVKEDSFEINSGNFAPLRMIDTDFSDDVKEELF